LEWPLTHLTHGCFKQLHLRTFASVACNISFLYFKKKK
jgi:hypothetical protein